MESIIKDQVMAFLTAKNLLSKQQHAFIAKHSTVTNLLECVHDWSLSLHNKVPQDVLYFDFSHAFDSVVNQKLLLKLQNFGIGGMLLAWIGAFLEGRSQCVVVEHMLSNWVKVVSGVPQGSVLGPLLFIVYIDDIVLIYPGDINFKLFADDLKLYSSVQPSAVSSELHMVLPLLENWCHIWQLQVNISKTFVIHLGPNNPRLSYSFDNNSIKSTESIRDLGVEVDEAIKFDLHISNVVKKAFCRVGTLFRGFSTREPNILLKAYKTYIRPIFDYASNVWSPYYLKYINAIERVQRNFTKRIPSLSNLSYAERLAMLDLETLECRRLKADLTMYYKIINNLTVFNSSVYFEFNVHVRDTRLATESNSCCINRPLCRTSGFQNDFFQRCILCWNSLPNTVVESSCLKIFKSELNKINLADFLKYKLL